MPHAISVGEALDPLAKPGTQELKHPSSLLGRPIDPVADPTRFRNLSNYKSDSELTWVAALRAARSVSEGVSPNCSRY